MKKITNYEIIKSEDRGDADHGWLKSKHTFSFAGYHNPQQMGFSSLRVINEDRVDPSMGFGMHPHKNMEIFSYVLSGSLQHRDSMNNGEIIQSGDVQLMSAGSGVFHSEFNPSEKEGVHFLQIWIYPSENGGFPRYQQKNFNQESKNGKLKLIISQTGESDSLVIKQNTKVYAGIFNGKDEFIINQDLSRAYYIHLIKGEIKINDIFLKEGDALKIHSNLGESDKNSNLNEIIFHKGNNAEVLVFDLNPTF